MKTTLNKIRGHSPCVVGWTKLLMHLNKTQADDEPISIMTILNANGIDDALWCLRAVDGHEKEIRLYAVWCARRVQHLMKDPRSIAAIDVAERYAHGDATDDELAVARAAAWAATWAAAGSAAGSAAWAAAQAAPWAAAWDAVRAAPWDAARAAPWDAARVAARDAAGAAAWAAQEVEFRKMLNEIEAKLKEKNT